MKKEPTPDEVERAWKMEQSFCPGLPHTTEVLDRLRKILRAAMNPSEIEITDEMLSAGNRAYYEWYGNGRPCLEVYGHIYRAMHEARPKKKPESEPFHFGGVPADSGGVRYFHGRSNEKAFGMKYQRAHRRMNGPTNQVILPAILAGGCARILHCRKGDLKSRDHRRKDDPK